MKSLYSSIGLVLSQVANLVRRHILRGDELHLANPLPVTAWLISLSTLVMVACIQLGLMSEYHEPGRYFREGRLITWISFFQLLAVGYICQRIWKVMRGSDRFSWNDPAAIWKIASVAFYFFAFDELCRVHEEVDRYFHKALGWKPTGLSDHIDDALIGVYGLVVIFALFRYWRQIPIFIGSIGYLASAFVIACLSIFFDFVSGDREILHAMFGQAIDVEAYMTWLGVLEEILKIYTEAILIGGVLYCFLHALKISKPKVEAAAFTSLVEVVRLGIGSKLAEDQLSKTPLGASTLNPNDCRQHTPKN